MKRNDRERDKSHEGLILHWVTGRDKYAGFELYIVLCMSTLGVDQNHRCAPV